MSDSLERYGIQIDIDVQAAQQNIEKLKKDIKSIQSQKIELEPTVTKTSIDKAGNKIVSVLAENKKFQKGISIDKIEVSEDAAKGITTQINGAIARALESFRIDSIPKIGKEFSYIREVSEKLSGEVENVDKSLKSANNTVGKLSGAVAAMEKRVKSVADTTDKLTKPKPDRSKLGTVTKYYEDSKNIAKGDNGLSRILRSSIKGTAIDAKGITGVLFGGALGAAAGSGGVLRKNEDKSVDIVKRNGNIVANVIDANGKLTEAGENVVKTIQQVAASLNVSLASAIKNIAALAGIKPDQSTASSATQNPKTVYNKVSNPRQKKQEEKKTVEETEKDASDSMLKANMAKFLSVAGIAGIAAQLYKKIGPTTALGKSAAALSYGGASSGGLGTGGIAMAKLNPLLRVTPEVSGATNVGNLGNITSMLSTAIVFALPKMFGDFLANAEQRLTSAVEAISKAFAALSAPRQQGEQGPATKRLGEIKQEWASMKGIYNPETKQRRAELRAEKAKLEPEAMKEAAEAAGLMSTGVEKALTAASGLGTAITVAYTIFKKMADAFFGFTDKMKQAADSVVKFGEKISNWLSGVWTKIKQMVGISSQGFLRNAISEVQKLDKQYAKTINTLKAMIGSLLQPISSALITILQQIMIYINAFVKALTGKDLLKTALKNAKAIEGHASRTKKKLSLASFDTIMNIGKTSTNLGGGGGSGAGYLGPGEWPEVSPIILDFIEKLGQALAPVYELFTALFEDFDKWGKEDIGVIVMMKDLVSLFTEFQLVLVAAKILSGDFGGALVSLGIVLGGSFLGSAMQDYVDNGGDMAVTTEKVSKFVDDLSEKIEDLRDWFNNLKEGVKSFVNEFDILPVIKAVADLSSNVGGLGEVVVDGTVLTGSFSNILKKPFYSALKVVGSSLGDVDKKLLEYDETMGNKDGAISLSELMNFIWDNMGEILSGVWKMIGNVAMGVINGVKATVKGLANLIAAVTAAVAVLAPAAGFVLLVSGNIPLGIALLSAGGALAAIGGVALSGLNKVTAALDAIGASVGTIFGTGYSGVGGSVASTSTGGFSIDPSAVATSGKIGEDLEAIAKEGVDIKEKTLDKLDKTLDIPTAEDMAAANGKKFTSALEHTKLKASATLKTEVKLSGMTLNEGRGNMNFNYLYAAKGTNFVPEDQFAQIHKGEAIIPRAFNTSEFFKQVGGSKEVSDELKAIRKDINKLKLSVNLDGREIANNTVKHINEETRLQGRSVLV